jgi:UDP-N-acetylmuramate: L-alanyl-gamma-D-glutamyl-meso-diaminopimelate ligase
MHFHLIGVCGTAMGSLAGMLKARGHRVTGSDKAFYPPMGDELKRLGIETFEGFDAAHLEPAPDLVVVGNATSRGNVEIETVLNRQLRYASMTEVLREEFIRGKHSTVVAGTHGKTTTTSLMAWVMHVAGLNPSFLIGGVAENFNASFNVTGGKHFVIEGDEYDTAFWDKRPKFLSYLPDLVILNNVEFDHADIYEDLEAVKKSFRLLINLVPSRGCLVAGWDSPIVRELIEKPIAPQGVWSPVETFGLDAGAKWSARDIAYLPEATRFIVTCASQDVGAIHKPLAGAFNVRNCLAVIAAATQMGIAFESIAEALATFKSVKRRMQVRGETKGITIIDDFAHHPTAVRETLQAIAQKYPDRRLLAVFEPRTWASRMKVFQEDYARAFAVADTVILAALYEPHRIAADKQMSIAQLVDDLRAQGKHAQAIDGADAIVEFLTPQLRSGDVVAVMSNGGFGGIHEKLLTAITTP